MATLERIRQRSGLLIGIIGVAMLAFILTDLLGSGNSILRADANVVGRVNNRDVEVQEFGRKMEELRSSVLQQNPQQAQFLTNKQLADGVWNEIVREELMQDQYDELGFKVTGAELLMRLKSNPSIQSAPVFQDQVTGQFSEGLFQQYINNMEANRGLEEQATEAYAQWIDFEQSEKVNALQTKYNKAVEKGLYTPKSLAKEMFVRNNTNVNARVVALEYSSIADSTVKLTDSDYKKYYNENKEQFKAEKAASIQFVTFDVQASQEDRNEIMAELNGYIGDTVPRLDANGDTIETFKTTKNDSAYAAGYTDNRRAPDFFSKDNLPQGLDSTIITKPVGTVVGPYEVGGYYQITKVVDKKNLPDSVKARHILISFQGLERGNPERTGQQAKELADSLLKVVKADTSKFRQLAMQVSDDNGSGANGGNLGWYGPQAMVRPFSNFTFRGKKGDIGLVPSRFGFHIIEIQDQKGSSPSVKLVTIDREITPSEATLNNIYSKAGEFAAQVNNADEFAAKAEELGYAPRVATNLKSFDEAISGLGSNRDIVKWANGVGVGNEESKVGDIQLFTSTTPYVVAILIDRNEEGYRDLNSIKEQIKPQVINDKKAEGFVKKFDEAMSSGESLSAVAQKLGVTENTINVNFQSPALGVYGNEPKVIGAITALETGKKTKTIKGARGVYVAEAISVTPAQEMPDYSQQKAQQDQAIRARVQSAVFQSLKDGANIDDRRAKFY